MTESLIQTLLDGRLDIVGDVHGEIDALSLDRFSKRRNRRHD